MTYKVYLSGGLVTEWQLEVMNLCHADDINFYNPKDFNITGEFMPLSLYSPMNKTKIENCDAVFSYLEASNPTCINVVAECCYALGLGKKVILVNEWNELNYKTGKLKTLHTKSGKGDAKWFKPRYLEMLLDWVDIVVEDLGIGAEVLRHLASYEKERFQ